MAKVHNGQAKVFFSAIPVSQKRWTPEATLEDIEFPLSCFMNTPQFEEIKKTYGNQTSVFVRGVFFGKPKKTDPSGSRNLTQWGKIEVGDICVSHRDKKLFYVGSVCYRPKNLEDNGYIIEAIKKSRPDYYEENKRKGEKLLHYFLKDTGVFKGDSLTTEELIDNGIITDLGSLQGLRFFEGEEAQRVLQLMGVFDLTAEDKIKNDAEEGRRKVLREIDSRQGQGKFKDSLMKAYGGTCAISGCSVKEVLEAAHIIPYKDMPNDQVTNGLLLRSDLHVLFDRDLIKIDPDTYTVEIAEELVETEYEIFNNEKLSLPELQEYCPAQNALQFRKNRLIERG
ncbi:MAG: HNH endonuclease signature motif containing protein [Alphaproteobacteria bacterium]